MKALSWWLLILGNIVILFGIARAEEPRQINTDAMLDLWGSVGWAWQRLEKGVSAAADKQEDRNRKSEQTEGNQSDFCKAEFDPIPLTEVTRLPKKRNIKTIKDKLGQPCNEDDQYIYYPTESGEVVRFNKRTGAGSFHQSAS